LGAVIFVAAVACALYTGTRADADQPATSRTVAPGDTLWSIAADHYPPSEDPRVAIEAIREANGLEGYRIQPGPRLELPNVDT
jgi:LysM repeat protein